MTTFDAVGTGWAATPAARNPARPWAYLPSQDRTLAERMGVELPDGVTQLGPEPVFAEANWWTPPHPTSLPDTACASILGILGRLQGDPGVSGADYWLDDTLAFVASPVRDDVIDRFEAANDAWWNLDITHWSVRAKRYTQGQGMEVHTDLHAAGGAHRKLAGIVQLSDPGDYTGGELVIRTAVDDPAQWLRAPRDRGSLVIFPGWANHHVNPLTSGVRWSLCVNGWGPRLK